MISAQPLRFGAAAPLPGWDSRGRLVTLLILVFAVSIVSSLILLPAVIGLVAAIVVWSKVHPVDVLRRLRYPSVVIFAVVLFLPFAASGQALWSLAGLTITVEGLSAALLVAVRFYAIMVIAIIFLGAAPVFAHVRAAREMGVPDLLTDLALLVVRYIEILAADLRQMRIAMRLRGEVGGSWRSIRSLMWLLASLLLRSHERSTRVYRAMRLRGYGNDAPRKSGIAAQRAPKARTRDWAMVSALVGFAIVLVLAQWVYVP